MIKQTQKRNYGRVSEREDSPSSASGGSSQSEISSRTSRARARLVIELDGAQHLDQAAKDAWRTQLIEQRGYKVIRSWDAEALTDIDGVMQRIDEALRCGPPR